MKPYKMWVVVGNHGNHMKHLIRRQRKLCVEAFNAWSKNEPWPIWRKQGWRIIRVTVSE